MIALFLIIAMATVISWQRATSAALTAAMLSTWLKAGRTPVEALKGLRDATSAPAISRGLDAAVDAMASGASLSAALRQSGLNLPAGFLEGLQAAETHGSVAAWLEREGKRALWWSEVKGVTTLGLVYPIWVLSVLAFCGTFLVTYILPTFVALFDPLGLELPWATKATVWLVKLGRAATGLNLVYPVLFGFAVALLRGWRPSLSFLRRLPVVHRFSDLTGNEEAAGTLASLLNAHTSLDESLAVASHTVSDRQWRDRLAQSARDVRAGLSLSASLRAQKDVPALFVDLCAIGEQTETLPEVLDELSAWYVSEIKSFTQRYQRMCRSALIWSMGLLIAVYALGVWLPMVTLVTMVLP